MDVPLTDPTPELLHQTAWTIKRMSRLVPRVNCLTQAVAAGHLLAQRGIESDFNLGVKREPNGQIAAHAWVTVGETIVIGGKVNLRHYAPLSDPQ
jgi:hypothetical protein